MERRCLLVFDRAPDMRRLRDAAPERAVLLPLSSDEALVAAVRADLGGLGVAVEVLDAAALVETEVAALRGRVAAWSARVGRAAAGGATVRERLFRPELGLSAWWFGLLAEKNPLKTDAFLHVAQLRAARTALAGIPGGTLSWAVTNRALADSLALLGAGRGVRLASPASGPGAVRRTLQALKLWGRTALRGAVARAALGPRAARRPAAQAVVFASYFPGWDEAEAAAGRYRSRYAGPLHQLLERLRVPAAWLLIHVPVEGSSWRGALADVVRMTAAGEKLFILDEFLSWTGALRVLRQWLSLAWESARVLRELAPSVLASEPMTPEAAPIMRALWASSFLGAPLMEGLLAAESYRAAFLDLAGARACVYWSEMHGWEKALVAAARRAGLRTGGYQHGSILANFFNYFPDPSEAAETGADALPLPDAYAADGEIPESMLRAAGWPGLTRVEALRYLPLRAAAQMPTPPPPAARTLLVACSIDAAETRALTELAARTFPEGSGVRLLLRGHPNQPSLGRAVSALGLSARSSVAISKGSLGEALTASNAVLTGSSGVGLEALAYGRETIALRRPDALTMNPLADFPERRRLAGSAEELSGAFATLARGADSGRAAQGRAFLARYWELNPELPGWIALLSRLRA